MIETFVYFYNFVVVRLHDYWNIYKIFNVFSMYIKFNIRRIVDWKETRFYIWLIRKYLLLSSLISSYYIMYFVRNFKSVRDLYNNIHLTDIFRFWTLETLRYGTGHNYEWKGSVVVAVALNREPEIELEMSNFRTQVVVPFVQGRSFWNHSMIPFIRFRV